MHPHALPHLLVPIDFRSASRWSLRRALQLAVKQDARLTLLHVSPAASGLPPPCDLDAIGLLHDVLRNPGDVSYLPAPIGSQASVREQSLQRLASEIHPDWTGMVDLHFAWRSGGVVEEILKFVREEKVDCIVLGVRRRLFPRLIPSLSESILRAAPCEVIVVRSAAQRSERGWLHRLRQWWPQTAAEKRAQPETV